MTPPVAQNLRRITQTLSSEEDLTPVVNSMESSVGGPSTESAGTSSTIERSGGGGLVVLERKRSPTLSDTDIRLDGAGTSYWQCEVFVCGQSLRLTHLWML